MTSILAIDPGTDKSAWVYYDPNKPIIISGKKENAEVLEMLKSGIFDDAKLVIEMIASYGMPVGQEVFETCVWIGRFIEARRSAKRILRKEVKLHMCGSPRANDSSIRQALIDKFGKPGTKKQPGITYGLKADTWQALALAVTAYETGVVK